MRNCPRIRSFYLGHQDLKGMFAVDAGSTQGVGEVMQQFNLAAKGVHAGGYDLLPKTLELIHGGFLDFTIDQQAYLQGFYTVMEMVMFLASGGLTGPADINTGLKFVTKASVGPYLSTKTRYEGSSSQAEIVKRSGADRADHARFDDGTARGRRPAAGSLPALAGSQHPDRGADPDRLFRKRQPARSCSPTPACRTCRSTSRRWRSSPAARSC